MKLPMQLHRLLLLSIGHACLALAISSMATALLAADGSQAEAEPVTSWKYTPDMPGARVEVYRRVGDVELNAYLFEPAGHKATDRCSAIVFFFGGGWRGGTPGQFLPQAQYLAERGMVAISVDYRVKSRHDVFPQDCLSDAKSAIRWVRQNADRLGIDPDRIVASGGSAGGHLAVATALVPGFEGVEPAGPAAEVSSAPNAMVLFNPAVMLAPGDGLPDLLSTEKVVDIRERANGRSEEISPIHFVQDGLPPSIIFNGTNDEAVPFGTVVEFVKRMRAAGNHCELVAFEGQPHGFFNPGRDKGESREMATRYYHLTTRRMEDFLVRLGYLASRSEAR